jgi:signal transduction histidine kinase
MRKLLRNKEIKRLFGLLVVLVAVISAAAFITDKITGMFVVLLGILFCGLFLLFSHTLYRKIAVTSQQIDQILQGKDDFEISGFHEGELSILQTEIQKMTHMLREQTDLLKKDKLYLSDSLADIAHQIQTPITAARILVSLLAADNLETKNRLRHTKELETLLAHMTWLVTALLKISKIDAGTVAFTPTEIPMDRLIDKALDPFILLLELHGITVERTGVGNVFCDLSWTSEALGNIIKNCMEHMEQGGTIRLETEENALYSQIIIRDTGSGFADEDLPHLFERFYKGKNASGNNYGIGLALCKMIITKQNGTIKALQNEPQGAQFIIKIYRKETV